MKLVAIALMSGMFAAASLRCAAETKCAPATVQASVKVAPGRLTLADLLAPGACAQLRQMAERVSLGTVPQSGSIRVFDGGQIRLLVEGLANQGGPSATETAEIQIPSRIVVERAGAAKSCAQIARFVASARPAQDMAGAPSQWEGQMDCAAAPSIPEDTPLELAKAGWNAALQRWEFALRCTRPEDCVPFLLWAHEGSKPSAQLVNAQNGAGRFLSAAAQKPGGGRGARVVKPGQTATLIWDQAGIRVVLPVTCLDAGGLGDFVRVRLNNSPRIFRAEVMGDGTLRASL